MRCPSRHEWTLVPPIGVAVHARVWDGPAAGVPVVLVAGLGVSSRYWVRLGDRLGGRFHVIAPDLPGFGRTPKPPRARWPAGPDAREQADQLLAWMDVRGINQAVLCGHSVGCQTVVDLATRFPDRVAKLVLAAAPFEPGRRTLAVCIPRLAWAAAFEVPSLPPLLGVEYASAGVARAIQQARRTMNDRFERQLPLVRAPALVVHGQLDPLVSRGWAEAVTAALPRAMLVEVERVGHAMHYSAATVTAGAIGDFLTGRLDVDRPPADGAAVVAADDPRRDPLGPPQPISPRWHAVIGLAWAAMAVALPRALGWAPRARRVLTSAAIASATGDALSVGPLPMVSQAACDVACGVAVVIAASTCLRREWPRARWLTAALGVVQIAVALLTAKPTGPVRHIAVRQRNP